MQDLKIVMPQDQAEQEINNLLDKKKVFPKQRLRLALAIDTVAEAMMYGLVQIHEDGRITQRLYTPVGDLTELNYAARVEPLTVNKEVAKLKDPSGFNMNLLYITLYTSQLSTAIHKLEPFDRNLAESISYFFQ